MKSILLALTLCVVSGYAMGEEYCSTPQTPVSPDKAAYVPPIKISFSKEPFAPGDTVVATVEYVEGNWPFFPKGFGSHEIKLKKAFIGPDESLGEIGTLAEQSFIAVDGKSNIATYSFVVPRAPIDERLLVTLCREGTSKPRTRDAPPIRTKARLAEWVFTLKCSKGTKAGKWRDGLCLYVKS